MPFQSESFLKKAEESVAAIETASRAEVVVVVAGRSGSYADVDLLWGILAGLTTLGVVLHSPWNFRPDLVLPEVVLFGILAWMASRRLDPLRRALTSRRRRCAQVEAAARQAFMEEGVSATRERTGVLVYVSLLEREVLLQPDLGLDGLVPRAVWNRFRHALRGCRGLRGLEELFFRGMADLAEHLPHHAPAGAQNPDEIPNTPRLRL
jgi:putative membrane protein